MFVPTVRVVRALCLVVAYSLLPFAAQGTTYYWDINSTTTTAVSSGSGSWNGTSAFWNSSATGAGTAFGSPGTTFTATPGTGDDLVFSAGTSPSSNYTSASIAVTTGRVANSLTFFKNGAYTLSGGDITLYGPNGLNFTNGTGVNTINSALILGASTAFTNSDNTGQIIGGNVTGAFDLTINANSSGAFTLSGLLVNNGGKITNAGSGAGTTLISSQIGSNVTQVIQDSATSQLVLSGLGGDNAYGALIIKKGTLELRKTSVTTVPIAANVTITLGDSTGSADATLNLQGASASFDQSNAVVLGGSTGMMTIRGNNNGITAPVTFNGGVTGTGNLTLLAGSSDTSEAALTFATNVINNMGTLTSAGVGKGATTISSGIGANVTSVTQNSGTSKLVLSGANSYTGATNISVGILELVSSLAGTAVNASAGSTFLVTGNSTVGTAGSGSVNIASGTTGGTLSMLSSAANTLTINNVNSGATALTMGGSTPGETSQLFMDYGATSDQIVLGSGLLANIRSSGVTVTLNNLGGYTGGAQTLISAAGGLNTGAFTLASTGNFGGYTLALDNSSGTSLVLTGTANVSEGNVYWTGDISGAWNAFNGGNANNSNWATSAAGTTDNAADPDATTNVFMTANTATNLTTTLGEAYTINSLTFTGTDTAGTGAVSVGGANALTINATNANGNTAGVGIAKQAGSGVATISAPVILGGNQTWSNSSSTLLTVTGAVSGTASLTLAANSDGVLQLGAINNAGTITNSGSGTAVVKIAGIVGTNVTKIIQNSTTSALNLAAANTFTGGVEVRAGTLTSGNNDGSGAGSSSGFGTGDITLGDATGVNNAAVTLNGFVSNGVIANAIKLTNISTATGVISIGTQNTSSTLSFSGGITGTNNINLYTTNTNSAGALAFTTNAINNSGTITNVGIGAGTVTISGGVGSNVRGIIQNSATSTLNITTTALTVNAGGTTLTNQSGRSFTVTGGVNGTGNLILNNNSTAATGISITTGVVNNIGQLVFSGTGTGGVSVAAGVGTNVTGIENSATGAATVGAVALGQDFEVNSTSAATTTLSGGVTGAFDLELSADSTGGITLSGVTAFNNAGTFTNSGSGSGTTLVSGVIGSNVTGVFQSGASTLSLTGTNLYAGATSITAGTLRLSGTGAINLSSGISVNGSTAKFVHIGTVAVTPVVTLTQGTVDGITNVAGRIGNVQVADNINAIVTAGNGGSGVLTIGTLDFAGVATVNLAASGATMSTSLATEFLETDNTGKQVVINLSNSGLWSNTSYNLISYSNSLTGGGLAGFVLGTVDGLNQRQSASLTNPAGFITLSITGDAPEWTGALGSEWSTDTLAAPKNWKLITGGTTTDYLEDDAVLFNNNAISTTVDITDANVNPGSTTFDNSTTKNYVLMSTGGFGIASGSLTKLGTGSLTITSINTYSGGTFIGNATGATAGTVIVNAVNALPTTGNVTIGGNTTGTGNLTLNQDQTIGSLTVSSTSSTVDTITIASGKTFTTGNVVIGANAGTSNTRAAFTGGGSMVVNGTSFQVGGATGTNQNSSIVTMTGLSSFTANLGPAGIFRVGDNNSTNSGQASSLALPTTGAGTTTITAGHIGIGDASSGGLSTLTLGTGVTTLNADTIYIGGRGPGITQTVRSSGQVEFADSSLGSIVVRAADGSSGKADLNMLVGNAATNTNQTANLLLAGHQADISVDAIAMANRSSTGTWTSATNTSTLTFDRGSFSANSVLMAGMGNTTGVTSGRVVAELTVGGVTAETTASLGAVTMAVNENNSTTIIPNPNQDPSAQATLNISGIGTTTMGVLTMSRNAITGASRTVGTNAIVNISGSTTTIASIVMSNNISGVNVLGNTAASSLNISGGATTVTGGINMASTTTNALNVATSLIAITGGALSVGGNISMTDGVGVENTTLTLDGGILNMNGFNIGATGALVGGGSGSLNFRSGTLRNLGELNGGGTFVKTGVGTLVLDTANAYTGGTNVTAGTLLVKNTAGSATGTGATSIATTGTLAGNGTLGATGQTTTVNGSMIVGDLSADTTGNLTIQGNLNLASGSTSILEIQSLTAGDFDRVIVGQDLTIDGSLTLDFSALAFGTYNNNFTLDLMDWGNVNPFLSTSFDPDVNITFWYNESAAGSWDTSAFQSTGVIGWIAVPEPGRAVLMLLGMAGIFLHRRR